MTTERIPQHVFPMDKLFLVRISDGTSTAHFGPFETIQDANNWRLPDVLDNMMRDAEVDVVPVYEPVRWITTIERDDGSEDDK
jgi:hypothetical protein